MELKKGQAFLLGTVIFTALFLMAALPAGPIIESGGSSNIQGFFDKSFREELDVFNQELSENGTTKHIKRKLYVYNQFIDQSSGLKGANFDSVHLAVIPESEKAVFINYREENTDFDYFNGSWYNKTVEPMQSARRTFSTGDGNITAVITPPGKKFQVDRFKPRLVYWMKMKRDTQILERSYTG